MIKDNATIEKNGKFEVKESTMVNAVVGYLDSSEFMYDKMLSLSDFDDHRPFIKGKNDKVKNFVKPLNGIKTNNEKQL